MTEHTGDRPSLEYLEVALARAIADQAVVQFATLPVLLAQLPDDLRVAVSQVFDAYRQFVDGATFYVAHIRMVEVPSNLWGVCRATDAHESRGLLVSGEAGQRGW